MEGKNNIIVVLLLVLIGIFSGVGLLIGVGNAVGNAVSPLNAKLTEIIITENYIKSKLATSGAQDTATLSQRMSDLQVQLSQLNQKLSSIGRQPQGPPPEDYNKIYSIAVGNSVILGNKNAPVTITEFTDLQCPFCAHFYSVVKDILAAYPDKVRVVIKNFPLPFHPNARPAAKLALAANEQGKYQGMMELLMQNGGDVSDAKIKDYAQKLGLDYNKLMADYKNKDAEWEKQLQDDFQLVGPNDVHGTPTFFINGQKPRGVSTDVFKARIQELLGQK